MGKLWILPVIALLKSYLYDVKKLVIILSVLLGLFASSESVSQKKYASVVYVRAGLTAFVPWEEHGETLFFPGLTIGPGLRIIQGRDFALVATLPVTVGAAFAEWDYSYLGVDVPAMLECHFGSSTGNTDKPMGFMLGAGVGYHYAGEYYYDYYDYDYEDHDGENRQLDFWGLRLAAGVTFGKDQAGNGDRMMIMAQYSKNLASEKKYTAGLGFYLSLGNKNVPQAQPLAEQPVQSR